MYLSIGAIAYSRSYFGGGHGPILIRWLGCSGSELSILQCPWTAYQNTYGCYHYEDAGVKCVGKLLKSCVYNV